MARDSRVAALQAELQRSRDEGAAAAKTERERLIRMVQGRAMSHNGPQIVTLEMNQMAAWMAGECWHGIPPPRDWKAEPGRAG